MSFTNSCHRPLRRFGLVLRSFLEQPGLAFSAALPEDHIEQVFREEGGGGAADEEVYTPAVTLWAFLSQVLFKEEQRSCTAAVARVVTLLVALGRPRPSDNTGAYCRARARLPEAALWRLLEDIADGCEQSVPEAWLWKQRHVHLLDGSTTTMPDTEANQAEYPQPATQREGLGFPIARFVVLLSLATAMVSGFAMGPYKGKDTGETALFRQIMARLSSGDIVLADRYFCGRFTIALLMQQGRFTRSARVGGARPPTRLSRGVVRGGDHADRRANVPPRRRGGTLSQTVAGGSLPAGMHLKRGLVSTRRWRLGFRRRRC